MFPHSGGHGSHRLIGVTIPCVTSQKSPSAIRPVTPGSPEPAPETTDDRTLLQERLTLFGAINCGLAVLFYVVAQAMIAAGREAPWPAFAHAVMLANVSASAWTWAWCRRGSRSGASLRVLEGVVTFVVGQTSLVVAAVVIPEPVLGSMVILLAISLALYSRAIFVPSSAGRTAVVSVLTAAPLAVYSALTESLRLSVWKVVWLLAAVIVATAGSAVIYGLRREVSRARRLGQYTLEGKLGEGGMGVVYRARHAMLRRPTAVKLLRPERAGEAALRRFEREVQLTASLAHPNTVAVFDFGRTPDGVFYYAMEYLPGLTLEEVVSGDGPQPGSRVANILRQILGSLAEAHSVGLIHRDVKPSNVILSERGGLSDVVKVLDFGLARELDSADGLSQTGALVGTPSYLAPEAIRAAAPDPRSDLYAVGAVGYLLLTGLPVFEGRTVVEVCGHHMHTAPVPPSERLGRPVPPPLESFILSCLAKDPDRRPQSAEAAADALAGAEAPPWTQADARAWWATRGRALVAARSVEKLAAEDTLSRPGVLPPNGMS
jgi:hypothetical protein